MKTGWTKKKLALLAVGLLILATLIFLLFGGDRLPDPELSEQDKTGMLTQLQVELGADDLSLLDHHTRAGKVLIVDSQSSFVNRKWMFAWRPKQALVAFSSEGESGRGVGAAVFQYDGKSKGWTLIQMDHFDELNDTSVTAVLDYEDIWGCSVLLTTLEDAVSVRYSYFDSSLLIMLTSMDITNTPVDSVLTELEEGYLGSANVFDIQGEIIWTTETTSGEPYPYEQLQMEAIQGGLMDAGIHTELKLGPVRAFREGDLYWEIISWTSGNDMGFSLLSGELLDEGTVYTHLESHLYRDFLTQDTPLLLRTYEIPNGENSIHMNLILNAWDEVKQVDFHPDVEGMEDFTFNTKIASPGLEAEEGEGDFRFVRQDSSYVELPDLGYTCTESYPNDEQNIYIYEVK